MNWQRWTNSLGRKVAQKPSRPVSYRPILDPLEDRTVLSPVVFRIRWNFSPITIDASLNVGTGDIPVTEQSPGSLTAQVAGRQQGDLDLGGGTLTLNSAGTQLVTRNMGDYEPKANGVPGSEPGNYGGLFSLLGENKVALRNLVSNVSSSGPLTLTPQGGGVYSFPSDQVTLTISNGFLDYETGFFGSGRTDFTGSALNTATGGTVKDNGDGSYRIDIPIDLTIVSCLNDPDCTQTATSHITGNLGGNHLPAPLPPAGGGPQVDPPSVAGLRQDTTPKFAPLDTDVTIRPAAIAPAQPHQDTVAEAPPIYVSAGRAIAKVAQHTVDSVFVDPFQVL